MGLGELDVVAVLKRLSEHSTDAAAAAFFQWLAMQPGYKSRISYADAEYFTLPERENRSAKTALERPVPSIGQILHVLRHMPAETDTQLRNRTLIAFILLTGVRDGAAASLKLKHVDMGEGKVLQDAREVRTKFAKTFTTWVLSCRRRGTHDRRRLGAFPDSREEMGPRRSALSSNPGRAGSRSSIHG